VFESSLSIFDDPTATTPVRISVGEGLTERLAKLNEPQRQAVAFWSRSVIPNRTLCSGRPALERHTLVEAITQIYRRDPSVKILFCANSNTCAYQTVDKIKRVKVINESDICRVNAANSTHPVTCQENNGSANDYEDEDLDSSI
jgi:hypothetical protein